MNIEPALLSVARAFPPGHYPQRRIYDALAARWESYRNPRVEEVFMRSDIAYRSLAIDLDTFDHDETPDELHARFTAGAEALGNRALRSALFLAGITPAEVDFLVVATCTGYLCPGLSAIYAGALGMPDRVQRSDLVGMGCAGALPALQRAHDFVKANPGKTAAVAAVEVCSACYYHDDTFETIVGNAICADGAAAMVVGMDRESARPRIAGFGTVFAPEYLDTVGFQNREGRLRIVLAKELRRSAGGLVRKLVERLLGEHGMTVNDVDHWIVHPGGRRIIDAVQSELGLTDGQLCHTRSVLRNFGNMSSATVLFVLQELLSSPEPDRPRPGETGLMVAMGPGLAVEGALLRW